MQRNNLLKNLMISGIPNDNLKINVYEYIDTRQKVYGILKTLDDTLSDTDYRLKIFEPVEGKTTHAVKVMMNDVEKKKKIIK